MQLDSQGWLILGLNLKSHMITGRGKTNGQFLFHLNFCSDHTFVDLLKYLFMASENNPPYFFPFHGRSPKEFILQSPFF